MIHHEALNLMEYGRMGGIIVVPIDCPRGYDLKWGLAGFHYPDLNGRGVGSQETTVGDKEGILHVPGRVVFRNIKGLKIVIIVLYVRATGDFEPHT